MRLKDEEMVHLLIQAKQLAELTYKEGSMFNFLLAERLGDAARGIIEEMPIKRFGKDPDDLQSVS